MGKKAIILVVDDEKIVRESLRDWLVDVGYRVEVAESGEAALEIIKRKRVKIMLADLVMPGLDGIELMKEASKIAPRIITVIITAYGSIQTAISAIREGAYDYIEKPFCPEKVELLVKHLVTHQDLVEENISLRQKIEDRHLFEGIIAKSPVMLRIFELIKTVAPTTATVMIGEGNGGQGHSSSKSASGQTVHRR
jgi:DNA-binding NtrC family response regulator